MATYANTTNQVAALKELYSGDDYMQNLVYPDNPLYALLKKDESPSGMAGKYLPVPLRYGNTQGRSGTFANAQSNQTATQLISYFVYRVENYGLCTIQNDLIEATKSDLGAFLDEAKLQMDSTIENLTNDMALDIFRGGTGARGRIGTFVDANPTITITLENVNDVVNFEVGMTLVASSSDGGAPSDDTIALTSVNRITGVLVGTASDGSLDTEWAVGGYLAVQGDVATTGSTTTASFEKMTGLAAWLPYGGPSAGDSFWNVNRTTDPTRLAGVWYNGVNESIEEAIISGSVLVAREGGRPNMGFCSFSTWAALEKELGSKVQYVTVEHDMVTIAFKGITVHAPKGPITIIPDKSCTAQRVYLLTMDTWKLRSLGKAPHILTYGYEGLEGLRVSNADALEIRVGFYGNLICNAPGRNCVIRTSI